MNFFDIESNLGYIFQYFAPSGSDNRFSGPAPTALDASQLTRLISTTSPEGVAFFYSSGSISFIPSERTDSTIQSFRRGADLLILERPFSYVVRSTWRTSFTQETLIGQVGTRELSRVGVIGRENTSADPFPVFLGYRGAGQVTGGSTGNDLVFDVQPSNFSYTVSSNSVFGSINAFQSGAGGQRQRASLRFDGARDQATNRLSGTVTDPTFGWTGTFRGSFFGPARNEMAVTFRVSNAAGDALVGDFVGQLN